jgi:phosphohistidine phosphatase
MRLYLVRHGKARPKDDDDARHLTDEGRAEVRAVARFLKSRKIRVAAIWHSRKVRAIETAEEMAEAVKAAEGLVERDDLMPDDPVGPVARAVTREGQDLMIVGHLPFLGRLASRLVLKSESPDVLAFTTGSVACLEYEAQYGWCVRWMVTPELM